LVDHTVIKFYGSARNPYNSINLKPYKGNKGLEKIVKGFISNQKDRLESQVGTGYEN
jgi:hypothetical protein